MEDNYVDVISGNSKVEQVHEVLQQFLKFNENVFEFPHLSENNKRCSLWSGLFQHLQNKSSAGLHPLCLASVRILSRDKTDLESLMCEKFITILIERAGLYTLTSMEHLSMGSLELPDREVAVEAMKCLCNIAYNSEVARALCSHTNIAQGLGFRMRVYRDIPYKDDIMLYDMKLLFILTALRTDIKEKLRVELHGMDYLISCQNDLLLDATSNMDVAGASASAGPLSVSNECYLNNNQLGIMCQILKTQFNLILRPGPDEDVSEDDGAMFLKLMPVLTALLYAHTSTEDNSMELRSDVANLLISVPPAYYTYLTPALGAGELAQRALEGRNVDALQALVQLLRHRLNTTTNTRNLYENLSPILTVLIKSARSSRIQRKHLRRVILPPLRDVSLPPEQGSEVRNQLCRLLTTPVTKIRDLVAEFIFVLCKEKVGRMVKYTGFGNAAGHLAQRGLLGAGGAARGGYSSSSSDSDTDEYLRAAPHIDPVVGCTRPPRADPFAGMTEEQKEYEAMKLVNLFSQLVSEGVVRPARAGPDGRPQPVDHVLELREHPPNRPQS